MTLVEQLRGYRGGDTQYRALMDKAADHIEKLENALRPFAKIKPSTLYSEDGSDSEEYTVILKDQFDNKTEFTGIDLANAREALA